jgi:DNA-binding MarR family transcriptional regulator
MASNLSNRDYRALAQFRHALRVFLRFSEDAARGAGVTPAQHQLLLAVRGHSSERPPTIGELAEVLQLRHHSAVELVDRAVNAGLVERVDDSHDRRRQLITITPSGSEVLNDLSAAHRDELRRFRVEMRDLLDELA